MMYEKPDNDTIIRKSELKQEFKREDLDEMKIKAEKDLAAINELIDEMNK